jgi:hypothetical protein
VASLPSLLLEREGLAFPGAFVLTFVMMGTRLGEIAGVVMTEGSCFYCCKVSGVAADIRVDDEEHVTCRVAIRGRGYMYCHDVR